MSLEIIGYPSHKESFVVFLVFGLFLGFTGLVLDACGYETKTITQIAGEAVALRIFLLFTMLGFIGLIFSSWNRISKNSSRRIRCCFLPLFRVGLTTGFIACGLTIGFGLSVFLWGEIFKMGKLINNGESLTICGFFLLSITWPYLLLSADILKIESVSLKVTSFIFTVVVGGILYKYENMSFWLILGITVICFAFGFFRRYLKKSKRFEKVEENKQPVGRIEPEVKPDK